jgi:hypothetical protein
MTNIEYIAKSQGLKNIDDMLTLTNNVIAKINTLSSVEYVNTEQMAKWIVNLSEKEIPEIGDLINMEFFKDKDEGGIVPPSGEIKPLDFGSAPIGNESVTVETPKTPTIATAKNEDGTSGPSFGGTTTPEISPTTTTQTT